MAEEAAGSLAQLAGAVPGLRRGLFGSWSGTGVTARPLAGTNLLSGLIGNVE